MKLQEIIQGLQFLWWTLGDFYNYCRENNIVIITLLIVFFGTQMFKKKVYEKLKCKIFIKHKTGFLTLFAFTVGLVGVILELLYNKVLSFRNFLLNALIVVGLSMLVSAIWKTIEKIDKKNVINGFTNKFFNFKIFKEEDKNED